MSATAWFIIIFVLSYTTTTDVTHDTAPQSASDPFAFLRPIDVDISTPSESTIHPTSTLAFTTTHPTVIHRLFTDDFICDADYGWSHCNSIHNTYHGPFNTQDTPSLSRTFQCYPSSSSKIQLSFSIAFDCNNAFSDEIALFMDGDAVAHYNPFPIDATTADETLLMLSTGCDQWFIRHITQSFSIALNHTFEFMLTSFLNSNDENLVLYDIQIECITEPTHAPTLSPSLVSNTDTQRLYVDVDDELRCKKYVKGDGLIRNLSTIEDEFIALRISIETDSELHIVSDMGSWTFVFSATNEVIRFYSNDRNEEMKTTLHTWSSSHEMFWISWRYNNFVIGMGPTVHKVHDIIILYRPTNPLHDLVFAHAVYSGMDWIFYDYPTHSEMCRLDVMTATSSDTLSYAHPFYVYSTENVNTELWQKTHYVMFDIYSMDSASIALHSNSMNASVQIIFESDHSIRIMKHVQIYCTQYSDYDLSLNWTFWIYWDDTRLLLGNGRQIGNGIIYNTLLNNAIDEIEITSFSESEWTFYSNDDDEVMNSNVMDRDTELFCKRYYTHSNSKSQISKLNTMIHDRFVAFSVQCSTTDNAPQIYLSYWNTQKNNNNNNNNNDFNIDNHWWWSIELQIAKQQIFVANNSDHQIASMILPTKFRIKDDSSNCYLDIAFGAYVDENHVRCCREHGLNKEELNVFWNCEGYGTIWRYSSKTKRIYDKEFGLFLVFGTRGDGLQITTNDRNAKVSPQYGAELAIKQSTDDDEHYRISFGICQLSRSETQYVYKTLEGKACFGYEAKFECDGGGVDTKLMIAALSGLKMNDWTSIWITSFANDNIKIGIGDAIGNEEDVVFAFEYEFDDDEYLDYNVLYDSLQYIWIDSIHATHWIFYDYDTSSICDAPIIKQYNVSKHILTHNVDYTLPAMSETFVPKYLWNDHYLMFNISSSGDVWIQFQMKTDDVFIVQYGKDSVKDLCDDTRGITDHVVIMKNSQYKYCSPYSGYDLSLPYLFWIYWKDNKLELGNGGYLGQSVITEYNEFNSHHNIESISIGSETETSIWRFYTMQKHFTLNNADRTFAPNDVLSFTFKYDKLGILRQKANISIVSDALNLNCLLMMNFAESMDVCRISGDCVSCNLYKDEGIKVSVPDYKHIRMHHTFDTEYLITIRSNDLLLAQTHYVLKRRHFMNLSIYFDSDVTIGSTLRLGSVPYDIHNSHVTQNASHIEWTCVSLGIMNGKILINYASDSCLICATNECNSCSDGIPFVLPPNIEQTSQHIVSMQSNDTHLAIEQIEIYVHPCDVGFGLNPLNQCLLCGMNYFNLDANDNECHSCSRSTDFNRIGYECKGSSEFMIEYNWWIAMAQYSSGWQYIFDDNASAYEIVSSVCPASFCCPHREGCNLVTHQQTLCAKNRDPSVALCGRCLEGYSEVYGSTQCAICDQDHYSYLLIGLLIGLVYALAVSFVIQYNGDTEDEIDSDSFKSIMKQVEEFNYTKLMMHDYVAALLISLFRPMTYFYQSMAYLLINYNYNYQSMALILQIFSLDLSINSAQFSFCFVSGLTALSEEVWLLFIPFSLFVSIGMIWMVTQCGASSYLLDTYSIRYSPNVLGMAWSVWLLSMSSITSRLFKIISCKDMGDQLGFIHFYAPEHECLDAIWYLALIALVMIVLFWSMVWFKVYQMQMNRGKASTLHHQSIISPYKEQHWYWEFVVQSRRMMIVALITFKYINEDYMNLMLAAVLLLYLITHATIQPFKHKRINNMESLCLLLFICCFTVINFAHSDFVVVFLTMGLVAPLLLFVTRIYCAIKLYCSIKYGDVNQIDVDTQEKLFKAINRLNPSKRDLIEAIMHRTMPHIVIPTTRGDDQDEDETNNDDIIITPHGNEHVYLDDDDDDADGEDELVMEDDNNSSNNMNYFHLNSPGAVPPLKFQRQITPASGPSASGHAVGGYRGQTKGEESASFTPLSTTAITATATATASNQPMVSVMPPAAFTASITYLEEDETDGAYAYVKTKNLMDYHQFIHKIEQTKEYSSTMYDESATATATAGLCVPKNDDVEQKYDGNPITRKSSKSEIDIALQLIDCFILNNDENNNSNRNNNDHQTSTTSDAIE
eukprot:118559_1